MAGKADWGIRGRGGRIMVLVLCVAGALAVLWSRVEEWNHYRREITRPGVESKVSPEPLSLKFSRFTSAELRAGRMNAFNMGKKIDTGTKKPLAESGQAGSGYEIVGVVKRGGFILVLRMKPGDRLAWLTAGDEITPGLRVETISATQAQIRLGDGSLRTHRVFELKEISAGESAERSRQ